MIDDQERLCFIGSPAAMVSAANGFRVAWIEGDPARAGNTKRILLRDAPHAAASLLACSAAAPSVAAARKKESCTAAPSPAPDPSQTTEQDERD
jgi:hypothetical protein